MKDKQLLKELDEIRDDWFENKNNIDTDLLTEIFKMGWGNIFTNSEKKIAVGFLPLPETLEIYFFQITKDDRLKYIAERGITIDDGTKALISHAIRLCELKHDTDDEGTGNLYQ